MRPKYLLIGGVIVAIGALVGVYLDDWGLGLSIGGEAFGSVIVSSLIICVGGAIFVRGCFGKKRRYS